MKKNILIILFFIVTVSTYAQNIRDIQVFVPPVTGSVTAGDNVFFYRQLTFEVVSQFYTLVRSQAASDYILKGTIALESETKAVKNEIQNNTTNGIHEFYSREKNDNLSFYHITDDHTDDSQGFAFILELINNKTGEVIGKQILFYNVIDASIAQFLSVMVYNMLSGFPDIVRTNEWRNKWLYLDAAVLWAPSVYAGEYQSINWLNFGLRALIEFHPFNFLSVAAGFQFKQDWIVTSSGDYHDLILEVPLLVKLVLKPADHFMLEPYGGLSINQSLMGTTSPSFLSWFAGIQLGVKAGYGMIVIDPCFIMDTDYSHLPGQTIQYTRTSIQIGIGYKFGFLLKKHLKDY
ncbi:MAG: hypothetical protein FWB86_00890 [Treponema sp.]|nr:hypothetical protein [Treponema sp.]MCL2250654.1 hypothetical protein [Treponema sp.]